MAERRMFAKTIVLSDDFLDMPTSTRCLYFGLGMVADDDGFINNPRSVVRQVGASIDDLNLLIGKRFVLSFDSGVIAIKHWKIHNYIPKDRYKETKYLDEKSSLAVDERGAYTECIQTVYKTDTQVRVGKDRLGQGRVVEVSEDVDNDTDPEDRKFEFQRGSLGKGVVILTPEQDSALLDKLGIDAYDFYVEKLAKFIIEKNATVGNHYATILKWVAEDSKV